MKKFATLLVIATFVLLAGNAFALPIPPAGYELTDAPYWTLTDLTTADANFEIKFEETSYESDFGLFAFDDPANKLQIFAANDEPALFGGSRSVKFQNTDGVWQAQVLSGNVVIEDWKSFDSTFGFYFGVHSGGQHDATADYLFYSNADLNTDAAGNAFDAGVQHVAVAYSEAANDAIIYLNDQLSGGTGCCDCGFDAMVLTADDVKPVPEPGTVLLLGVGLIGVIGLGRKRINK